jgi:GNAT superfamily N-acetyltransferase
MSGVRIVELDASAARRAARELGVVLADCVEGGASVSFMAPYSLDDATAYFERIADQVARAETVLLAAYAQDRLVGTVQLGIDMPPNQPHRADVKKLLVHRDTRRGGIGELLMQAVEAAARARGRTLLVLDTASDAAERLYERSGWTRVGVVPDYALWPSGGLCATTFFWKALT